MPPNYSYDNIISVSEKEFREKTTKQRDLENPDKFTKSSEQEIITLEKLLDLKPGILGSDGYYLQKSTCECGHTLTMKDFVLTALVDAKHERSLIIQTFLGNKFVINKPRPVRCFECGTINPMNSYAMAKYGCGDGIIE